MAVYYNENDPFAAEWLRQLIRAGAIAPGDVDDRSIVDVTPVELKPYDQHHFFAGIGVWSYALRRAGWPDDKPVWTGSCPCQPFSAAGKRGGSSDDRDLWWAFFWLISQCQPETVFGEQVASKDGLSWWDTVQTDLEGAGYAATAFDLCAAGIGAPHIRQRLFWVADKRGSPASELGDTIRHNMGRNGGIAFGAQAQGTVKRVEAGAGRVLPGSASSASGLADAHDTERRADITGRDEPIGQDAGRAQGTGHAQRRSTASGLADAERYRQHRSRQNGQSGWTKPTDGSFRDNRPCTTDGHWRAADWLWCRDNRWRPVEPGTFPLANGAPARVGRLRGYGNAIVAPLAQAFIESYQEINHAN